MWPHLHFCADLHFIVDGATPTTTGNLRGWNSGIHSTKSTSDVDNGGRWGQRELDVLISHVASNDETPFLSGQETSDKSTPKTTTKRKSFVKVPKKCVRNEGNSIGNTSPEWWKPAPHLHIQLSRPSPIYSRNLVSIQFPGHSSNFTIFPFIHQFVSYDWRQQQQMLFTPISLFFPSKLLLQFTKPLTAIINHEAFLFCFSDQVIYGGLSFPRIFSRSKMTFKLLTFQWFKVSTLRSWSKLRTNFKLRTTFELSTHECTPSEGPISS